MVQNSCFCEVDGEGGFPSKPRDEGSHMGGLLKEVFSSAWSRRRGNYREERRKSSSRVVSGRGLEGSRRSPIMPLSYPTQGKRSQAGLLLTAVGS